MNVYCFIKILFKKFRLRTILNASVFMANGLLEMISVFTIVPLVDVFLHSDLNNISGITEKWIALMGLFNMLPTKLNFIVVMMFSITVASILGILTQYMILQTKYAIEKELRKETLNSFFNASWHFFAGGERGIFINTFNREMVVVGNSLNSIGTMFSGSIRLIFYAVVPIYISWQATAIAIGMGLVFSLPFVMLRRLSYRFGREFTSTSNRFNQKLQESFEAAKVILGYGNQRKNVIQIEESFDEHCKVAIKSQLIPFITAKGFEPFAWFSVIFTIYYSITYLNVTIAEVAIIVYALFKIFPLMATVNRDKNSLTGFIPSYEQIDSLNKQARLQVQKTGNLPFRKFENTITCKGVTYAYSNHKPVLSDIDIVIEKGKTVAIVGESGAGKSTLIDILIGFCEPHNGIVTVDGISLFEYDIKSFRQKTGFVPQDSILFHDTIRNNLLWSYDTATENEVEEACKLANAHDFIMEMPEGYNTVVGDRGVRLSGGQRQRIALARALLRKPELLILDEATSSLDSQSETLIQEAIEKIAHQTTMVIIAHRLSTIANADWIYVLEEGRVVEQGTYGELIGLKSSFKRMAELQGLVK
jgi:ATP-binding cassette subfamily B protein